MYHTNLTDNQKSHIKTVIAELFNKRKNDRADDKFPKDILKLIHYRTYRRDGIWQGNMTIFGWLHSIIKISVGKTDKLSPPPAMPKNFPMGILTSDQLAVVEVRILRLVC